jgi:hypothetical protein
MKFLSTVKGVACATGFFLKQHSPEILAGVGVLGTVTSFVLGCKATLKVDEILQESKEELEKIEVAHNREDLTEKYSEEDYKHDKFYSGLRTFGKLAKVYAVPILVGVLSVGALLLSNRILSKRNAALAAAYTTVNTAFKQYRENVVERFGEEVDYQLRNNIKALKITEKVVDEDGNETEVEKEVFARDESKKRPPYEVLWADHTSTIWTESAFYGKDVITTVQNNANQIMRARAVGNRPGYIMAYEVLDMLGMTKHERENLKWATTCGWLYYKNGKNPNGDNYVDLGLTNQTTTDIKGLERFLLGYESTVWLNLNVDGPIVDLVNQEVA